MFVKRKLDQVSYIETEIDDEEKLNKKQHLDKEENFIIKFHKNINLNELEEKVKNHIISMKIVFIKLQQVNLTLKSLENDKDIERFKFLDKIFKILVCQIKEFPFLAK